MRFAKHLVPINSRSITVDAAGSEEFDFQCPDSQRVMISVASDVAVSFYVEFGRAEDSYASLPYSSSTVSVLAGDSSTLEFIPGGGCDKCRLVISNATGGAAAVIRDVSLYAFH